jgi:hypothetical protein
MANRNYCPVSSDATGPRILRLLTRNNGYLYGYSQRPMFFDLGSNAIAMRIFCYTETSGPPWLPLAFLPGLLLAKIHNFSRSCFRKFDSLVVTQRVARLAKKQDVL